MAENSYPAQAYEGKYLRRETRKPVRRRKRNPWGRCVMVVILLLWDGTILYMILHCLIAPAWGAVFMSVLSVYMGYQIQ